MPESYAVVRTAAGRYALTHDGPVGVGRRGYFVAEVTDRRNDVWTTQGRRIATQSFSLYCFVAPRNAAGHGRGEVAI